MFKPLKAFVSAFSSKEKATDVAVETMLTNRVNDLIDCRGWTEAQAFYFVQSNELEAITQKAKRHVDEIME